MRTSILSSSVGLALASFLVLHSVACGQGASSQDAQTGNDENIIGGVDATSAKLDAVGALLYKDQNGQLQELCSAALIGPRTILTAKHCAVQFGQTAESDAGPAQLTETRFLDTMTMFFAFGSDARAPKRTVQLDGVTLCDEYVGGWIGMGCDFSVYHLSEEVSDVKPLRVATSTLDDTSIDKRFTAIGYGMQNETQTALGTRKAGTMTLRATQGAPLRALYPTFDAFANAVTKDEGIATEQNSLAALQQIYATELKSGYEVFVGGAQGDAQVCFGDSGGPLIANVNGELVIQGVASGLGLSGTKLPCNMGAVYAVPGPAAQQLIKDALTDPCDGVPALGRCEGDVAVR